MREQVVAQIVHEDRDRVVDVEDAVLRVARAVADRVHAVADAGPVHAQVLRVRDDVPRLVQHRGRQVVRVGVDARGGDEHVGRDGHVVVQVAVCAAVGVLARPDLPDAVHDVHAEVF